MKNYTNSELNFVAKMGWTIKEDGLIHLTTKQYNGYCYTGRSFRNPEQRTLQICSCLLFEGLHFIVD